MLVARSARYIYLYLLGFMLTTVTCKIYVTIHKGGDMRWDAAKLGCEQIGGNLARPISKAETAFLLKISKTLYYWIDAKKSGATYVWSDGSSILHTDWDTSNGSCSSDACHIRINQNSKWFVAPLDDTNSAICELPLHRFNSSTPIQHTVDDTLQKLVSNSTKLDLVLQKIIRGSNLDVSSKLDRSEMEAYKLEHDENVRISMLRLKTSIEQDSQGYFERFVKSLSLTANEWEGDLLEHQRTSSTGLKNITIRMDEMESKVNGTIISACAALVADQLDETALSECGQRYQEYGWQLALNNSRQLRHLAITLHKDRAKLYVISPVSLIYLEAKEYCRINRGHLVRLQGAYEAEYITSHVTNQSYWIDAIKNGSKYIWAGESEIHYANWKSNQTACSSETCAIFVEKEEQTWVAVDYGAGARKMAVCEKDNRILALSLREVSPNAFTNFALISVVALAVLNSIIVYAHLQVRREVKILSMRKSRVVNQKRPDTGVLSHEENNDVDYYELVG